MATPIVPAPRVPLQRVTNAPEIMNTRDPTSKHNLIITKWTHRRQTRKNTLGDVPAITRQPINVVPDDALRHSARLDIIPMPTTPYAPAKCSKQGMAIPAVPLVLFLPLPGRALTHIISQQALTAMVRREAASLPAAYSPHASPVVHPVMGKHIMSYKRLLNDPVVAEMWQTVIGKDFGGMVLGNNKTSQKGTNSIFVITHDKIKIRALPKDQVVTYAKVVINQHPQKENLNRV